MEQTLADVQHDADGQPATGDAFANMSGGRIEPTRAIHRWTMNHKPAPAPA
jgi:hypothetical protein